MTHSPRTKRSLQTVIDDLEETLDVKDELTIDYGDLLRYARHLGHQEDGSQTVEEFFGQPIKLTPQLTKFIGAIKENGGTTESDVGGGESTS